MTTGDIILTPLTQADGQTKVRPVVIIHEWKPFGDILVCGVSTQLHQFVPGFDELLRPSDPDFERSGLRSESIIRLAFLGTVPRNSSRGFVGRVARDRLTRLRARLSSVLRPASFAAGKCAGIIPARYGSTRFPGKALALMAGKPLIQWVVEGCRKAKGLAEVIVATDDARIQQVAQKFCRVEMTRADHPSGSDRIAEVAARLECDAVINIQGDEPLIDASVIDAVVAALADCEMSTAAAAIRNPEEYENANVVKVVVNAAGRALYFSRRTIPYLREAARGSVTEQLAAFPVLKHIGIYGYRREALLRFVKYPVSPLENAEKLEQLRALENGIEMAVVKVDYDSIGVDTPEDVARVETIIKQTVT